MLIYVVVGRPQVLRQITYPKQKLPVSYNPVSEVT